MTEPMGTGIESSFGKKGEDAIAPALAHGEESGLFRVAELADELGAELIASAARAVTERVAHGRFYVACVGQFKRGKSTLVNALIGQRVLPAGVIPVTTVATVVRYGENLGARVCFQNAGWNDIQLSDIEDYASEERNPGNAKQVAALEIFVASPLLASGMCFVDTPGLGSIHAANTAATHAFIPHIDAAIVVIGADPPLSGDELQLVEAVGRDVRELVFVLNKADRTSDSERAAASAFARRALEVQLNRVVPTIFEVSALDQLEGRGDARDWTELVATLESLSRESGSWLVRQAAERGLRRTAEQLRNVVQEERAALLRPVGESERRISELRKTVDRIEQSLHELHHLFSAEQERLSKSFEERRKLFLHDEKKPVEDVFEDAVLSIPRISGPAFRRETMHVAQEIARVHIIPWLQKEGEHAEEGYRRVAQRFADLANEFMEKVRNTDLAGLGSIPGVFESERGFRTRSQFHFLEMENIAAPASPLRYLADATLGTFGAYGSIVAEAREFLNHLLETNSSRVQSDVDDRVAESRKRLESEVRSALEEVIGVAERALSNARAVQASGAEGTEAAHARLNAIDHELRACVQSTPD